LDGTASGPELTLGPATVSHLDVKVDSTGLNIKADGKLTGDQIITVKFDEMGLDLTLNSEPLATVKITNLDLVEKIADFKLDAGVAPSINMTPRGIESANLATERLIAGKFDGLTAGIGNAYMRGPGGKRYKWMDEFLGAVKVCTTFLKA
jgi:hypothetical protein